MLDALCWLFSRYKDDKKLVSDGHIVIEDATEGQACSTLSIGHFCHADVGQVGLVNYYLKFQYK